MIDEAPSTADRMLGNAIFNPDAMLRMLVSAGRAALGVITAPIEMVLRPRYGTLYINPITQMLSWLFLGIVFLIGKFMAPDPRLGIAPHAVSIRMLVAAFALLTVYHGWRTWRLMVTLKEDDSEDEGPPSIPFPWLLPHATWATVRIFYEPLTVAIVSLLLYALRLMEPFALLYLMFTAEMLMLRALLTWFEIFLHIRSSLDGHSRARTLMGILQGRISPKSVSPALVARMPAALPFETRTKAARIMTGLDPALDALVSLPEPPTFKSA